MEDDRGATLYLVVDPLRPVAYMYWLVTNMWWCLSIEQMKNPSDFQFSWFFPEGR